MKDLKDITQEEIQTICDIYDETFVSFLAGVWDYGLAITIDTTASNENRSEYSSYIAIYYDGKITLKRNNGNWGGMITEDINPLIAIDYLRSLGYEFKYEMPKILERKLKLKKLNKL